MLIVLVHSKNSFVLIAVFLFNLSDESVAEPPFIPVLDPLSHPARRWRCFHALGTLQCARRATVVVNSAIFLLFQDVFRFRLPISETLFYHMWRHAVRNITQRNILSHLRMARNSSAARSNGCCFWHPFERPARTGVLCIMCQLHVCVKTLLKVYFHLTRWNTDVRFYGNCIHIKHECKRKWTILTVSTCSNTYTSAHYKRYQRYQNAVQIFILTSCYIH